MPEVPDESLVQEIEDGIIAKEGIEPFKLDFFLRRYERIKAFLDGKVVPPYEAEVQPSSRCNAKCEHCWGNRFLERGGRLRDLLKEGDNMETVIRKLICAEAEGFKLESVKFIGSTGDPLLNPKTLDAINILKENGRKARMFTNGLGLVYETNGQTYAEKLVHLDYLRVSLDAGCEETLYNVKGRREFGDIMRGVKNLRSASDREKTGIFIHASFVITDINYQDIEKAAKRVKDAGAHGIQYRRDLRNPELSTLGPDKLNQIEEQLASVRELSDDGFIVTQVRDINALSERCYHPFFWVTVGSDGCLYPCGHRGLDYGWNMGDLLNPENDLMGLLYTQNNNPRVCNLPDSDCEFCPPNGLHANRLMDYLAARVERNGFQQALDIIYERHKQSG